MPAAVMAHEDLQRPNPLIAGPQRLEMQDETPPRQGAPQRDRSRPSTLPLGRCAERAGAVARRSALCFADGTAACEAPSGAGGVVCFGQRTFKRREAAVQDQLEVAELALSQDDSSQGLGLGGELVVARSIAGEQVLEDATVGRVRHCVGEGLFEIRGTRAASGTGRA